MMMEKWRLGENLPHNGSNGNSRGATAAAATEKSIHRRWFGHWDTSNYLRYYKKVIIKVITIILYNIPLK